jgi:hypothetical protein
MDISMRPNPFALVGAHALASLPLSFSMMKTKREALKMLCCSIFARVVEEYFQPLCFEPLAPVLMGFVATAAVQKWVLREDKPLPLIQAGYLNLGARAVMWVTALAALTASHASSSSIAAMTGGGVNGMVLATVTGAAGGLGGAALATWAVYKIAQKIFHPEKPKTA